MSTRTAILAQPALDRRQRVLVLLICSTSLLLVGLDVTIVSVALPDIRRAFHATLPELQWTVDAYTLVLASLLLLAGSTADRLGRRRVFQAGLAIFSLGSLLCALAPGFAALVAARALQAAGGAMLSPVAMSIVRNVFEDPRERARAIGVFAATFGVSMALGPVLGGFLVSAFSWRAVFLVTVPAGLAAIALTARYVPESRAPRPRRVDPVGQVLVIVTLAALTFAAIEAGAAGFGDGARRRPPGRRAGLRRRARALRAAPRATRWWSCASSPAPRSPAPARSPSASPRRSAASCSSTRSTCRTCAGSRRCTPASTCCPWRRR